MFITIAVHFCYLPLFTTILIFQTPLEKSLEQYLLNSAFNPISLSQIKTTKQVSRKTFISKSMNLLFIIIFPKGMISPWQYLVATTCSYMLNQMLYQIWDQGLPWWRSGWESACQCRRHGFEPWSGKIPHATEQLSLWATTTEPACLELVLRDKGGRDSERPVHRDEEWSPLAATRESPRTEMKTQHSQK